MLNVLESKIYKDYKNEILANLSKTGVDTSILDNDKLDKLLLKDFKPREVVLHNNIKDSKESHDLLTYTENLLHSEEKNIFTALNTIFHNHSNKENYPSFFLDWLGARRKKTKHEANLHINDVDKSLYLRLNATQLILKLFANSYYGSLGMKSFHFFNTFLGPSVTAQGRQLISASILAFEGFIGNNMQMDNFHELITFIDNIDKEEIIEDFLLDYVEPITTTSVRERLLDICNFRLSATELEWLDDYVKTLSPEKLHKFYFKNNLFEFFKCGVIKDFVKENFNVDNFTDVNNPPAELTESLAELNDIIRYFVSYPYLYSNKTYRAENMYRNSVLVCDTDSNFIYVYEWLEYMCELLGLDINELTIHKRASYVSVINYFLTKFVDETFRIFCGNSNVPESEFKRINMKSEFHLRRTIVTKNKKSYASIVLSKEGKLYNEPVFDIKGISIRKTSTPKPARIFFGNLLEDQILNSKTIDIKSIYKTYNDFAQSIQDSILSGDLGYLKNGVVKQIQSYKNPYRMQTVRSVLTWNALNPKNVIVNSTSFKILDINPSLVPPVAIEQGSKKDDTLEYVYNEEFSVWARNKLGEVNARRLEKLYTAHPELMRYGFTHIALPLDSEHIPSELLELANMGVIVNSIMRKGNILLETLGFVLVESRKRAIASNILRI